MKGLQVKSESTTESMMKERYETGWAATQICKTNSNNMINRVLLDIGASISIFCNPKFCKEVKPARIPMRIQTNSGSMLASEACDVPELGEAYLNNKGLTNIIGLSQIRRQHRVTYDFGKEPASFIHMDGKIVKFPETNDGLYALDL